ncbi:hypothetical protein BaRGS_00018508 [Batillaria attramentaria]|uniref:Uncharacterized protein n=1 Tax=Batillaria attramentaria TaxID=370345 RepID=A0ABD0KSC9_9CAEN
MAFTAPLKSERTRCLSRNNFKCTACVSVIPADTGIVDQPGLEGFQGNVSQDDLGTKSSVVSVTWEFKKKSAFNDRTQNTGKTGNRKAGLITLTEDEHDKGSESQKPGERQSDFSTTMRQAEQCWGSNAKTHWASRGRRQHERLRSR